MSILRARTSRVALSASAGLATVILLAACSPAAEPESSGDAGFEGVELTVWNNIDFDPYQTLQKEYFEACAADLGIKVEVETLSGDYTTSLLQAASSKSLPDIALLSTDTQLPQLAEQGVLADLGELGLDTEGLADSVADLGQYDGTLYALPVQVEDYSVFYNKEIFDAAGITELPTTFDELVEVAKATTTADHYGIALPGIAGDGSTSSYFLPFLLSAGGDPAEVTSDGAAAAIDLYKTLVADGSLSKEFVNWGWDGIDQWTSGKAAITVSGPWNLVDTSLGFEYGTFPIPAGSSADESSVGLLGYGYGVAVQGDEKREKAAAALVECRASEENQIDTAVQGGYVPALTSAQDAFVAEVPAAEAFVTPVENAFNPASLGTEWNALQQKYVDALQNATVNGVSAEEALSKADQG
ncbi:extracellular solute-binding protein [Microbacterium sp. EST19A]|uniref:sugar ABC transporter substrate-binding protein n=1 Tax=Microbacterium sp. EST19A TaxID=2862681 RepID=UPI001CBF1705|nr:extracellular solute-binding protein [Microbacterium sp. EST19A]